MNDISSFRGSESFPPWHQDYIPTATEWLNCFSNKADASALDDLRNSLFPSGGNGDGSAYSSILSRLSSLEEKEQSLSVLSELVPVPATVLGSTLDDVDAGFFTREQARLLAALETQQRHAQLTQQAARAEQKIRLTLQQHGVTS